MIRTPRLLSCASLLAGACLQTAPALADAPEWQAAEGNPAVACLATYQSVHKAAAYSFSAASPDGKMAWALTGDDAGLHVLACLDGNVEEGVELGPKGPDLDEEVKVGLIAQASRLLTDAVAKGTFTAAQAGAYRTATGEIAGTMERPLRQLLDEMKRRDPNFLDGRPHFDTPVPE